MEWLIALVVLVVVVAVLVDRRRRGGRGARASGDDRFRDAGYGEAASTAHAVRRSDTSGTGSGG